MSRRDALVQFSYHCYNSPGANRALLERAAFELGVRLFGWLLPCFPG